MAKSLRAGGFAGTDFGTPCAEKITGACRIGHLVELLDEDRALRLQPFDDIFVMHDLVTDIDRRAMDPERLLHGIDGTTRQKGLTSLLKSFSPSSFAISSNGFFSL